MVRPKDPDKPLKHTKKCMIRYFHIQKSSHVRSSTLTEDWTSDWFVANLDTVMKEVFYGIENKVALTYSRLIQPGKVFFYLFYR